MALDEAFKTLTRERRTLEARKGFHEASSNPRSRHNVEAIKRAIADIDDAYQVLVAEKLRRNAEARKEGK
jgi:hypothetical protein